jgi:LL-diaminopimelate aminotransferase
MIISPSHRMSEVTTYYFARKLAEIEVMNKTNELQVLNLGIGSPDMLPPAEVMSILTDDIVKRDAHKYQSYKGLLSLRQAFADWYGRHFGVGVDPASEILPLIGSKEGIMHISMAFLNPNDQVLVPNPGYPSYTTCTRLAGGTVVEMPLEENLGWQPDIERLEDTDLSKVKMMWLNYPNMPTGAKADITFFDRVMRFVAKHKILVCHDNPYVFILNDQPISILQADPDKQYTLELTSLSKNYNMAGWRIGAVTSSKEIIDTIMTFKSNMDSGMFRPLQAAAIQALNTSDHWIETLNSAYTKRKLIAAKIMDALDLSYDMNCATLFLWGKIKSEHDGISLADEILYGAKVFITPGSIFGSNGDKYLRISLCSNETELEEALDRIQTFLQLKSAQS